MQYFRKELPQRTLFAPDGSAIPVEILDSGVGVITTDHEAITKFLIEIDGTQGVSKITQKEYRDLKKKTQLRNLHLRLATEKLQKPKNNPGGKPASSKVGGRGGCGACGSRKR